MKHPSKLRSVIAITAIVLSVLGIVGLCAYLLADAPPSGAECMLVAMFATMGLLMPFVAWEAIKSFTDRVIKDFCGVVAILVYWGLGFFFWPLQGELLRDALVVLPFVIALISYKFLKWLLVKMNTPESRGADNTTNDV